MCPQWLSEVVGVLNGPESPLKLIAEEQGERSLQGQGTRDTQKKGMEFRTLFFRIRVFPMIYLQDLRHLASH